MNAPAWKARFRKPGAVVTGAVDGFCRVISRCLPKMPGFPMLGLPAALIGSLSAVASSVSTGGSMAAGKPNVLFVICDQYRADAIAALGNPHLKTPNIDRLVQRGMTFSKAYATTPECVPSRYSIITGREAPKTGFYNNAVAPQKVAGQPESMEERCGIYLARRMGELGYRTFGIGKFHTTPDMNEDIGFETYLPTVLGANANKRDTVLGIPPDLPLFSDSGIVAHIQ